jgi:pilus assembly protein CpaE
MKIILISSNKNLINEVSAIFNENSTGYIFSSFEGGIGGISNLIKEQSPDIIMLECAEGGDSQLNSFEPIVRQYAKTAFILIRNIVTPDFLINSIRLGIADVLPTPISHDELIQAIKRVEGISRASKPTEKKGKVIAFVGAKGGVGTTFLACNFAYILAGVHERKVTLLDLDLQFGDALLYLSDIQAPNTLADLVGDISRLDSSLLESSMVNILPNFGVLASSEDAERSEEIKAEHIDALLTLAKSQFDYIILDIGRTLNATSVKALDHSNFIFLVMQTTLPCIRSAKRLISIFKSLGYNKDKVKLIINRYDKGSDIQIKDVELTSGMEVFAMVPNSYHYVSSSVNQGIPILNVAKHNPVATALYEITQKFVPGAQVKKVGWLFGLFQRLQSLLK